jgi:hypothetical protein
MSKTLAFHGENLFELLHVDVDHDECVMDNDEFLKYLNPRTLMHLGTNGTLRRGYVNIFQIVAECLEAKRVPNPENIERCSSERSLWQPGTHEFLRFSGTDRGCHAVLRFLFDASKERDEKAGNGATQVCLGESWPILPVCRNDNEFEFVAKTCGYPEEDSAFFLL